MKNAIGSADRLNLIAPSGGVVSGTMYRIGGLIVIAEASALVGELFSAVRRGKYSYAKAVETVVAGDVCFFNTATNVVTKTSASGLFPVGTFVEAAASGADGVFALDGTHSIAV